MNQPKITSLGRDYLNWLFVAADINQGGKQRGDGHGGSRYQRVMQRSRRSEESVSTCSLMHQGTSGWPANHARSGPSARDSCAASRRQIFGPYTDGSAPISMLRGRVRQPQDTSLHQLLIHEHLRCPTLPQIWRGNFWDQCLKLLLLLCSELEKKFIYMYVILMENVGVKDLVSMWLLSF